MANGYFRLVKNGLGFGIQTVIPTGDGEPIKIGEVADYLAQYGISCDITALKDLLEQRWNSVMPLGSGDCPSINMSYKLLVEEENMRAIMRLYPPSETGKALTAQDILGDLAGRQIKFGVLVKNIEAAVANGVYCTDIVVAEGQQPREGKDAVIEYYFNADAKARPTLKDDGSVDFFHLNTISHCKAGDTLAHLIPADLGENGTNIMGVVIKPRPVKNLLLKYGKNVELAEDKLTLKAQVSGHVTLEDERVVVSNVLELKSVDMSTGNIEYDGSVTVTGDVQANFSVRARGNIVVNGLVESAYLEATGDIIIARGMAGMNKGELKAGGNVVAKFFERAKVSAGGYITAESIMHSTVMAGKEITVDGRRGFIAGGRTCATNLIKAKTFGSTMGTSTVLEVGADPAVKVRFAELQKTVGELNKVIDSLDPIISTYIQKRKQGIKLSMEQLQYLASVVKTKEQKLPELKKAQKEMDALAEIIDQQAYAQVVVQEKAYPGVKVVIGDVSMVVQKEQQYCRFVKQQGDVKVVGM
ncbi:MAG: FapA family protein [Lachnospiraceae bacterium]|nr:FapA family protein [Lachnospiraceae bacterium]